MSSYVGRPVLRREDLWLLRGAGQFVDDIDVPADALHLSFVLSPEPHAKIDAVDTSAALELDGVFAVLTGDDIAALVRPILTQLDVKGYRPTSRDAIARDRVRFVGEYVAVCVAESPYIALDAADRVAVSYSSLPSVSDALAAELSDAPVVHELLRDNTLLRHEFSTADFDDAFASAPHMVEETFRLHRVAAVSMEPRGVVAIPERAGSALVVHTSTQVPHIVRSAIAEFVDIPESKIRVVVPDVGGGFGMKAHVYPDELIVAALAWKYRRAIKWIQDRREDLLTNAQARDHRLKLSIGFDDDGAIVAMKNEVTSNAGAYSSYPFGCTLEPLGAARMSVGPYRISNYRFVTKAIATNTCPTGAYRGTGSVSAFVAMEGMLDRIARRLGLDPAEIRKRNLVSQAEMPYVNAVGVRYDTGSYQEALQTAKEAIGYDEYRRYQPADRLVDGKYRGIGIASFVEVSGIGAKGWAARGVRAITGYDSAIIKIEPSGHVTAFISQAAAGQGHLTTFAQIIADHLGARFEDVTIIEGDTASAPYGSNTFSSRGAVAAGGATILASQSLNGKIRRIAGDLLEASPDDIVLEDGAAKVVGTGLSISFKEIAKTAYSMTQKSLPPGEQYGLEAFEIYDPPPVTLANSTHIVAVAVGADDGVVEIERYAVAHDCGRIINPLVVGGQVIGAIAQGVGEALMEEIVYDSDGQHLNANLLDYLLPTSLDMPSVKLQHIETPSIDTIGGFKGAGEGGIMGAVPAILNAVNDALAARGANLRSVPVRPDEILKLIREGQQ